MRMSLVMSLLLAVAACGCNKDKKIKNDGPDTAPPPAAGSTTPSSGSPAGSDPKFVSSASGSNPVNPNQSGNLTVKGGEGAIQSPRMAAARTINDAQMKDLHLSIFYTFQLENRVPDVNEIILEARKNRQLLPLLSEEVVILTGTKSGDGVWAYSQYPQRNGNHYVIVQSGRVEMSPEDLRKRLQQQMSAIKMSQ